MIYTFTYGDPDPKIRDSIGATIVADFPDAIFYCDRFTGMGQWIEKFVTDDIWPATRVYPEHSGVIVADISLSHRQVTDIITRIAWLHNQDAIGVMVHDHDQYPTTLISGTDYQ